MRNKLFLLPIFFAFIFIEAAQAIPSQIFFFPEFLTYNPKEIITKVLRSYNQVEETSTFFFVFPVGDHRSPKWVVEKFIWGKNDSDTVRVDLSSSDGIEIDSLLGDAKVGGIHFLPELFFVNRPDWQRHRPPNFIEGLFMSDATLEKGNRPHWASGQASAVSLIFESSPSSVSDFFKRALLNSETLVVTFGFCDKFTTPETLNDFFSHLHQFFSSSAKSSFDILMYHASAFLNSEIDVDLKSSKSTLRKKLWGDRWTMLKDMVKSPIWISRTLYKTAREKALDRRKYRLYKQQFSREEVEEALKKPPTLIELIKGVFSDNVFCEFLARVFNPLFVAPNFFMGNADYNEAFRLYEDKLNSLATLPMVALYPVTPFWDGKVITDKEQILDPLSLGACVHLLLGESKEKGSSVPSSFEALRLN